MATLRQAVQREGIGLHGGRPCRALLAPAPPGLWIAAGDGALVRMSPQRAGFRPGRTVWQTEDGEIDTPEHLGAALVAYDLFAVSVRVWGGEMPALDGCAAAWCHAIAEAGVAPAEGPAPLHVDRPFAMADDGGRWSVQPGARAVAVAVDFGPPLVGDAAWEGDSNDFRARVAPARTFVRRADVEVARAQGRGAGASDANTVVVGADASAEVVDEAVRHKLLDAIGDLALLGAPIHGRVLVDRPGHRLHVTALRAWAAFALR